MLPVLTLTLADHKIFHGVAQGDQRLAGHQHYGPDLRRTGSKRYHAHRVFSSTRNHVHSRRGHVTIYHLCLADVAVFACTGVAIYA